MSPDMAHPWLLVRMAHFKQIQYGAFQRRYNAAEARLDWTTLPSAPNLLPCDFTVKSSSGAKGIRTIR